MFGSNLSLLWACWSILTVSIRPCPFQFKIPIYEPNNNSTEYVNISNIIIIIYTLHNILYIKKERL